MNKDDNKKTQKFSTSDINDFAWEVIDALGQGVTILDKYGRFEYVNPAFSQMVGRSSPEIIGKKPLDFTHTEDHESLRLARKERQSGIKTTYESRLVKPDGEVVYTQITGAPRWDGDTVIGTYSIITDITDRMLAEQTAQMHMLRYQRLFENATVGVYRTTINGRFLEVNPAFVNMLGYDSVAEVLALKLPEDLYVNAEQRTQLQKQSELSGVIEGANIPLRRKDGQLIMVKVHARIIHTKETVCYEGIVQDITNQYHAENTLRQSEANLRAIFENTIQGFMLFDQQENILAFNDVACVWVDRYLSVSLDSHILGTPFKLKPNYQINFHNSFQKALNGVPVSDEYEIEYEGKPIWFEINFNPVLDDKSGKAVGVVVSGLDITDRKLTEQKLRESEQKYAVIFDKAPFAIGLTRAEDKVIVQVNDAFLNLFEFKKEEVVGNTSLGLKIAKPEFQTQIAKQVQKAGRVDDFRAYYETKSGKNRLVSLSVSPVIVGNEPYILTTGRDITELELALEALRESEEKMRLFIEHAPASIAMFDMNMKYLAVSRRWFADYNLADQDIVGLSHYEVFPEISERWKELHRQGLKGEVIKCDEDKFLRSDGSVQWVRWELRPWYTADHKIGGMVIFTEDITDHKKVKEELQLSEKRYRAIVEDQTELIIRLLVDGTILFANEAYCRMFGRTSKNIVGENIDNLLDEDTKRIVRKKIKYLTVDNPINVEEHQEILADGRKVWLRWTDRGFFDENGRLTETQGIGYDITEQHQIEEKLRQSSNQLKHIIDSVPEGVLLLSIDGSIRLTNPIADSFLKILVPNEINGRLHQLGDKPLKTLLTPPPNGLWHEVIKDDQVFEAIAKPVEEAFDNNSGWVLVLRDITQERNIQKRAQQQERLAAVGQLAAGIAHDFNNIMAVITLYTELISRTVKMPARAHDKLTTIEKQAQLATDLIQQILDFSRQSVLERRPLDLVPFMKELVRLLERTLPENIQVTLDIGDDEYLILADPSRIQQVMMNLAVNARDATPNGGRLNMSLTQLSAEDGKLHHGQDIPTGDWIRIQVSDSGIGIPSDLLSQIFEPFFTTKEVGKGTGLGLAQVYGIVQQHDGFIDVSSTIGKGTTFYMYFPVFEVETNGTGTFEDATLQLGHSERILLVEDDPMTREALVESLSFLNYQVIQAQNGREALAILQTKAHDISLVLSDVVMPEMGGVDLLHLIREQNLTVPVVLLTGHPLNKELEDIQSLEFAGWLSKPPNIVALSQLIAETLQSRQ